jgi:hypothetical protein
MPRIIDAYDLDIADADIERTSWGDPFPDLSHHLPVWEAYDDIPDDDVTTHTVNVWNKRFRQSWQEVPRATITTEYRTTYHKERIVTRTSDEIITTPTSSIRKVIHTNV